MGLHWFFNGRLRLNSDFIIKFYILMAAVCFSTKFSETMVKWSHILANECRIKEGIALWNVKILSKWQLGTIMQIMQSSIICRLLLVLLSASIVWFSLHDRIGISATALADYLQHLNSSHFTYQFLDNILVFKCICTF